MNNKFDFVVAYISEQEKRDAKQDDRLKKLEDKDSQQDDEIKKIKSDGSEKGKETKEKNT